MTNQIRSGIGKIRFPGIILLLVAAIVLAVVLSVSMGQVDIPFGQSFRIVVYHLTGHGGGNPDLLKGSFSDIIWLIRFPRVLMAMLIGAGLALCGTVMQASVQNPLADPYILGISSGASLGATFAILVGFGASGLFNEAQVAMWAFLGALGASMLVMLLAGVGGKITSTKLVLSGMVINSLCGAFSNFIVYFANSAEGIRSVTFWLMGSLASAKWDKLPLIAIAVIAVCGFFLTQSRALNTMLLGDEAATTLGMNLSAYRRLYMCVTALLTGFIVSSCGMIGFVGLIVPHIVRGFVGSDHKRLLPTAILAGALFLTLTDLVARVIISSTEIPIGIVTAMCGAPMFMYMLIKKGYGFGGR